MGRLGKFIVILLTVVLGLWVLMPTIKWYFFIPEEDKELLKIPVDELETQSSEIKKKVMELKNIRQKTISLGLDLQGGVNLTLQIDEEELRKQLLEKYEDENKLNENFEKEKMEALERGLEVLKNRMDQFGVAEPVIRKTFEGRISVELPGLNNPQLVREALNKVGRLEFHIVDEDSMQLLNRLGVVSQGDGLVKSRDSVPANFKLPDDSDWFSYWENDQYGIPKLKGWLILKKRIELDGSMVKDARYDNDPYGRPEVKFELTDEGGDIFQEVTAKNVNKRLAIVLDGRIKSAPNIKQEIAGGSGVITGSFTVDEAIFLANILKSGALPVKLQVVQERIIGPTLGKDSILQSSRAMVIGAALVLIFMIVYYKMSGVFATIALVFNMFYLMALLASVKATLTLSGIAGIALTVGMAVDASVLIFERIKEELRNSSSFKNAIANGFDHAKGTILDANITTIFAAAALYVLGSGTIKGFGLTLLFGIIANLFAALFITKFLYEFWLKTFKPSKISI